MSAEAKENTELEMEAVVETVKNRLARIRTGKATPVILDGVKVEYYGTATPLKQLAGIAAPEPRLPTTLQNRESVITDCAEAA